MVPEGWNRLASPSIALPSARKNVLKLSGGCAVSLMHCRTNPPKKGSSGSKDMMENVRGWRRVPNVYIKRINNESTKPHKKKKPDLALRCSKQAAPNPTESKKKIHRLVTCEQLWSQNAVHEVASVLFDDVHWLPQPLPRWGEGRGETTGMVFIGLVCGSAIGSRTNTQTVKGKEREVFDRLLLSIAGFTTTRPPLTGFM